MPRAPSIKQFKGFSGVAPDDGDVLIWDAAQQKYVPGPQGSASIALLNKVVTFRSDAQVAVMRSTGDVVYFR